jgi:glutamine amidotransferase PdxT
MFGTCAGCILLSKSIDGMPDQKTLQLVDMSVNRSQYQIFTSQVQKTYLFYSLHCFRNAYGSQVDSFESDLSADESVFGSEPLRAILIRAPMITKVGLPIHEGTQIIDEFLHLAHL